MVAQGGRGRDSRAVGFVLCQLIGASDGVVLAQRVQHLGVEVLEPHTHGAVAVLEPGGDEAMLHLGHFDACGDH